MTIPALDVDHLKDQTQGDAALERQLLALFRLQAHEIIATLKSESGVIDVKKTAFAHLLKGSALAIGATRVAAMAAAYESLAAQANQNPFGVLEALQNAIDDTLAAIDHRIGPNDPSA